MVSTTERSQAWLPAIDNESSDEAETWAEQYDISSNTYANEMVLNLGVFAEDFLQVGSPKGSVENAYVEPAYVEQDLRSRLDNANNHFRRKAAEVFGNEQAVLLLANLYQQSNLKIKDFDFCKEGLVLAKLTAANFCEIGSKVIYITEAGRDFIEVLDQ